MRGLPACLLVALLLPSCGGQKAEQDVVDVRADGIADVTLDLADSLVLHPTDTLLEIFPDDGGKDFHDMQLVDTGPEIDLFDQSDTGELIDQSDAADTEGAADTHEFIDIDDDEVTPLPDISDAPDLLDSWDVPETTAPDVPPETKDSMEQWDACEPACGEMKCGDDGCGGQCG